MKNVDLLRLCRPHQWTKNGLCLAGPLFTTLPVSRADWEAAALALVAFCVLSSATYAFNDIVDADADRRSARKATRPVASGRVSVRAAGFLVAGLLAVAVLLAQALPAAVRLVLFGYVALNLAYSTALKRVAIVDVFCISLGFLLRLLAGIYAIGDKPTAWIVMCTLFLTMFIGFAKRRAELAGATESGGVVHRPALSGYSVAYLDFLVSATSTMAIVTYALFTTTAGRDPTLLLTVLPVVYGIFHYQRTVMLGDGTDAPDLMLLKDRVLMLCILVWLVAFLGIVRWSPALFR